MKAAVLHAPKSDLVVEEVHQLHEAHTAAVQSVRVIGALGMPIGATADVVMLETSGPQRCVARVTLSSRELAPGNYTITLMVTDDGGFVAEYQNLDMWTATCDDGRQWAIFAGPDGSAQVRDCVDVAEFGLPQCKVAEPAEAKPS